MKYMPRLWMMHRLWGFFWDLPYWLHLCYLFLAQLDYPCHHGAALSWLLSFPYLKYLWISPWCQLSRSASIVYRYTVILHKRVTVLTQNDEKSDPTTVGKLQHVAYVLPTNTNTVPRHAQDTYSGSSCMNLTLFLPVHVSYCKWLTECEMKTLHQKRSRCTCMQSSTAHVRIWVTMISKFLLVILLLHVVNRHCTYTYVYNWIVLMALHVDPFSSMKCVLTYFGSFIALLKQIFQKVTFCTGNIQCVLQ